MRVTSELFVSALTKRVFADGGFAAVARRGAREAGAIFIVMRAGDGALTLFGPATQASYDDTRPTGRRFSALSVSNEAEFDKKMERELRFDPDIWIVEIEVASASTGTEYLDIAAD